MLLPLKYRIKLHGKKFLILSKITLTVLLITAQNRKASPGKELVFFTMVDDFITYFWMKLYFRS